MLAKISSEPTHLRGLIAAICSDHIKKLQSSLCKQARNNTKDAAPCEQDVMAVDVEKKGIYFS